MSRETKVNESGQRTAPARSATGPGDRLVRIGAIVFFVGAVATLVTVAPLFLGTDPFPSAAYAVCMLMGVGFLIAAGGVVRSVWAGSPKRAAGRT
ncbi:hypothetical protein ACPXCE_16205 [Streptomyces sp. DT24]|uniref:hypothetical protein n=1 Tax=unclassified Streptomyces TaxID=2593676 RepID=UPI0023B98120|nr:hypothetical protein [Streptomyces sp. AM 4-1-1]WEH35217.1 hypothetical protein PZB75_18730 [Streptomyces sp. AM 4-1-1]